MIDFHSHILPAMDDGAKSLEESLELLRRSFRQGVDVMVSTSHFYAYEESPQQFIARRTEAFHRLEDAMLLQAEAFPAIILGAEVLYFPGISQAEEVRMLTVGRGQSILVEPPMSRWTDMMLDEIAELGVNLDAVPVIAHVDRFMTMLSDQRLIDRVLERNMLVQVNADYFLNPQTVKLAFQNLKKGKIHLIGSDCHNLTFRCPNLGEARRAARQYHAEAEFRKLSENSTRLLARGWK